MNEHPILFSGPMVQAILEGRKTLTRRAMKPQPRDEFMPSVGRYCPSMTDRRTGEIYPGPEIYGASDEEEGYRCPYGEPGRRLWVKENVWMWCEKIPNGKTKNGRAKFKYVPLISAPVYYRADHPDKPLLDIVSPTTDNQWGWRMKVGRFMPRKASRITLEIVGVRVERLHDISRGDCMAEGCPFPNIAMSQPNATDPKKWYSELWESINGPNSWTANPWVWVLDFKQL